MRKTMALSVTTTCFLFLGVHTSTLAVGRTTERAPSQNRQADHMKNDQELFQYLLSHRSEIQRNVKKLKNGVETITESNNPQVVEKIREHVESMHHRVKDGRGIHLRDPLFAAVFRHSTKIRMSVEKTEKGVKVIETSEDPFAAKLVQAHANVVSLFIQNGHTEVRKNHPVPDQSEK